jgi:hypothetical protein
LKNISIDSLDSILYNKDGLVKDTDAWTCLMERSRCCTFDEDDAVANYDTDDLFSCNDAFVALQSSFEFDCYANWPNRAMFPMVVNNLGEITQPNQFEMENSMIVNTFYAMNAIVQMADT